MINTSLDAGDAMAPCSIAHLPSRSVHCLVERMSKSAESGVAGACGYDIESAAGEPPHTFRELHGYRAPRPVVGGPGLSALRGRRHARSAHQPPGAGGGP